MAELFRPIDDSSVASDAITDITVSESDDEPEPKRFRSAMGEAEKIDWLNVWHDFRFPVRTEPTPLNTKIKYILKVYIY